MSDDVSAAPWKVLIAGIALVFAGTAFRLFFGELLAGFDSPIYEDVAANTQIALFVSVVITILGGYLLVRMPAEKYRWIYAVIALGIFASFFFFNIF